MAGLANYESFIFDVGGWVMTLIELIVLSVGLSMDAFAVALCAGLTMNKVTLKKALIVGAYFGIFQAGMPLIGYLLAIQFADRVTTFSSWIAFALLSFLGVKMLIGSFKKEKYPNDTDTETSLSPKKMLPLAVATSIDAMAVGVSLAFLYVRIITAVSLIGILTLVISMIGVKIGHLFGTKIKSRAELLGSIMLIGIGLYILLEHLGLIST